MFSVLVTGSNRGIGLELVKKLASHSDPPKLILATCRNPEAASELTEVSKKYNTVKILKLDVSNVESYPEFVSTVSSIVKDDGLNVLINNAGILSRCDNIADLNYEKYVSMFETNTFAPLFLSKALLPLIKKAAANNSDKPMSFKRAAIINISSTLGSVSDNSAKGMYWGYSESKAALNLGTRSLSKNVKEFGILALVIHPGWVRTDMGGPKAPIDGSESANGLVNVIYGLTEKNNDSYLSWDGKIIPW